MAEKLPEDRLKELLPGLGALPELVTSKKRITRADLESILFQIGAPVEQWAFVELEVWIDILSKCVDKSQSKVRVVADFGDRGIREFPAILAYEKTIALAHETTTARPRQKLTVDPQQIDYGELKLGEEATRTLRVTGTVRPMSGSRRLRLKSVTAPDGSTLIQATLSEGTEGESFRDQIVLVGDNVQLSVKVTAHWTAPKEPPLLSWCPNCGDRIRKKSLFFNSIAKKYECFSCKREYPYPDKRVTDYNTVHK